MQTHVVPGHVGWTLILLCWQRPPRHRLRATSSTASKQPEQLLRHERACTWQLALQYHCAAATVRTGCHRLHVWCRQGNATATVDCVSLLGAYLAPIKSDSASGKLLQQVRSLPAAGQKLLCLHQGTCRQPALQLHSA